MSDAVQPELLLNLEQMSPADDMYPILVAFHQDLVVRAQTAPDTLIPAITRIVHDLNPRAMSPKVKGFVSPQSWFLDLTLVSMQ